jgi:hypothetical protein
MGIDLGRFRSKKNDEWLDWLADDPVPASLRQRMRAKAVREASRPVVRRPGQTTNTHQSLSVQTAAQNMPKDNTAHSVSINISFPKFKKPTVPKNLPKLPKNLSYKQLGIGSGALVAALLIGVVAVNLHRGSNNKPDSTGVLSASDQKPSFPTIAPTGNSAGKASAMKYNAEHKIVTFVDSIGGVDINVTEQALPDNFKDNTDDKVKKLAEGFSANEVLSTANPTAYLGTSVEGPQSVIFHKNGLLIFIKSKNKIDNHDWAEYITNLK